MKKVLKIVIALSLLLGLTMAVAACGGGSSNDEQEIRIALVAHSPDSILNDNSFNQGAWDGITRFLNSNNLPMGNAQFFQPNEASDVARLNFMRQAIEDFGANVLVLPGFHFNDSLYDAQDMWPDVTFIMLDSSPQRDGQTRIESNVVAIHYAEHESGFLAGYAIVREGHRNLGFLGGIAVPAVVRFGHGFVQGAEHAAAQMGLGAGEVVVEFGYLGGFGPSPERAVQAGALFADGTSVIFAAAGGAGESVMSAAQTHGALVIGVDTDQAALSPTVITSAMKALAVSVNDMLTAVHNDTFQGGRRLDYSAANNGVALPMATSRFTTFAQSQYDAIFAQLANGSVRVNNSLEMGDIRAGLRLVVVND
jgi:basic membrane protein A